MTQAEGDELRSILFHLRHVQKIQYKDLAHQIGVDAKEVLYPITGRRSRGNAKLLQAVKEFAGKHGVVSPIAYGFGSQHGLQQALGLDNLDLMREAQRVSGVYLAYVLLSDGASARVGVTRLTLASKIENEPLPSFYAWRPSKRGAGDEVIHRGYYFFSAGSLQAVGHSVDPRDAKSCFLRTMVLESVDANGGKGFFGPISTSSRDELLFQSWCLLEPRQKKEPKDRRMTSMLQVFSLEQLRDLSPDAFFHLGGRKLNIIARRPSIFG